MSEQHDERLSVGRKSTVGCVSTGEVVLEGWGAVAALAVAPVQPSRVFQHPLHVRPVTDTCAQRVGDLSVSSVSPWALLPTHRNPELSLCHLRSLVGQRRLLRAPLSPQHCGVCPCHCLTPTTSILGLRDPIPS